LRVRNFRSIEDLSLELGPLSLLVGPNGAGKSNVMDVLRFLRDALNLGLERAVLDRHGMSALRRWSRKGRPYDVHIEIRSLRGDAEEIYAIVLGSERRGEYRVKVERYYFETPWERYNFEVRNGTWKMSPRYLTREDAAPSSQWTERSLRAFPIGSATRLVLPNVFIPLPNAKMVGIIADMAFYSIYPDALREPQKPDNAYRLEERGRNLASVLRRLKRSDESRPAFDDLLETLRTAVEGISDISVAQVGGYLVTRLHHGLRGPAFPLSQESDGTLRLLGLLTALYQWPPPSFIALEEPELTLHPGALAVLRDALISVSRRTQLLITTHSPDLLYDLPPETIKVVEMVEGKTLVGDLAPGQRDAIAEKLFYPGELMRIEGLRRAHSDAGTA
jgi:predicted ATPase